MKKLLAVLTSAALLAGCAGTPSGETSAPATEGAEGTVKEVEKLVIGFVPSREPEEIVTATEPLEGLLQSELLKLGYDVKEITVEVGTTYEAVGEGLSSGTIDVGLIPGGTYVLFHEDGVEVILAATRAGLSKDFENAADWNDGQPTLPTDEQVTYYRSLVIAGPSEKGQALAAKVNNGEALTWEDVNGANWCTSSTTSSAGYIYPSIWLSNNFDGKMVVDLEHAVQTQGYPDTAARLASGQCDIGVGYADFRRDYEEQWTTEFGGANSIWEDTNVIGVTDGIMNDTVSVSTTSETLQDQGLVDAIAVAFQEMAKTPEGLEVISIYSHEGYKPVTDADYDVSRQAQALVAE